MGRNKKSSAKAQGAGAPAPLPPAGPSTDAPAPESVQFSSASVEEQLRARYVHACKESANTDNQPREQAQFAMLAARLLKDIASVAKAKEDRVEDQRLLEAADRLEELLTKGGASAGDPDTEPPFDAPEATAPN